MARAPAYIATCCPFDPMPSLSTLPKDERRMMVAAFCGLATQAKAAGMARNMSVWRVAASYYMLARLGIAQVVHDDGGLRLEIAPGLTLEGVH